MSNVSYTDIANLHAQRALLPIVAGLFTGGAAVDVVNALERRKRLKDGKGFKYPRLTRLGAFLTAGLGAGGVSRYLYSRKIDKLPGVMIDGVEHKYLTPRQLYAGPNFDKILDNAKKYRETNPHIKFLQDISDRALDRKYRVYGGVDAPKYARGFTVRHFMGPIPIYRPFMGFTDKSPSKEILDHEMVHAMQRASVPSSNISYRDRDSELEAYGAELARRALQGKGLIVANTSDADQAMAYGARQHLLSMLGLGRFPRSDVVQAGHMIWRPASGLGPVDDYKQRQQRLYDLMPGLVYSGN